MDEKCFFRDERCPSRDNRVLNSKYLGFLGHVKHFLYSTIRERDKAGCGAFSSAATLASIDMYVRTNTSRSINIVN